MANKRRHWIPYGILILSVSVLVGLSACGQSGVSKIAVTPEQTGALSGSTVSVKVKAFTANGKPAENMQVKVSSPTEGVTLSEQTLTLNREGEADLKVTLSPKAGESTIVFQSGDTTERISLQATKVSRLEINPGEDRFEAGQTVAFQAKVFDELGYSYPVSVAWSLTGEHAELKEDGKVFMKNPGQAVLVAEYQGITQGRPFTVIPGKVASIRILPERANLKAGETLDFRAEAFNAHGYPVAAQVQWTAEGNVGSVAPDGAFLAKTVGTGSVNAVKDGIMAEAPVDVKPGPLASILINLDKKKLEAGQTIELAAQGVDAFGNRFPVTPQWYVSESIGSIEPDKPTFTALHTGTGEIRAKVGDTLNAVRVEVAPAQLAKLEISPQRVDLIAGETARFEVAGFDRFGNPVQAEPQLSLREPLGELSPSGSFSASKAGSTVVEARAGDITAQSTVAVKPAEMARVEAREKGSLKLTAGVVHNFNVAAVDRFGNTVQTTLQWKLSPDLGSIDDQGIFLPKKVGKGQAIASATQPRTEKTLSVKIPFTVTPGETERIAVKPAEVTTVAGRETKFSATAYDRFGNETGTSVDWSVREPTLGNISKNGRFIAVKAESGEVIARHGNVTAAAGVQVKPAQVTYLKIVPDEISLEGGEKLDLKAVAEDRFGNAVDADITWSLSESSLGSITPDGALIAKREGSGSLIAAAGNIVDTAPLQVSKGPVVSMKIEPEEKVVRAGANVAFRAVGYDAGGNRIELDPKWSVEGELGAIGENGILLTRRTGTVNVEASYGELQDSASIRVAPGEPASIELSSKEMISLSAGETVPLSFQVYDAYRNPISDPDLKWEVEQGLGYVGKEGKFHAQKAGEGAIRLSAGEAIAEELPVRVVPGSIARVVVEPSGTKLTAGEQQEFSAAAYDAYGNRVEAEPAWSVVGGLGAIGENGVFQAQKSGNGYVSALMGDAAGVASIGVLPGAVARIDVQPGQVSLQAGSRVDFRAVAYDAYGNITPADVSWTVKSDAPIGEISSEGALTARKSGEGSVIATAGDVTGGSDVSVEPGALASIIISPQGGAPDLRDADTGGLITRRGPITLTAGDKLDVEALGRDRFGNVVSVSPKYSVEPASLGAFTEDGYFVAQGAGSGKIVASARGVSDSVPIEVERGDLSSLSIELPDGALDAGKSYRMSALGFDEGCNRVPVDPKWAVSEDIGRIDQDKGILHARKAGEGTVVAYSGDIVARAPIKVKPGELVELFIAPNPVTVKAGELSRFDLYGLDRYGNRIPLSVSAADWSATEPIGEFKKPGQFRGESMGNGKVTAQLDSLSAESYVSVAPGNPDPENSRIRITYQALPADGQESSDVIVEVRDSYNNPVPGVEVTVVSNRQEDTIVQPPTTNEQGLARGRISSSQKGSSTIKAVVEDRAFIDTEQIQFG